MSAGQPVVVVGAGIGGLTAAATLAHAGRRVLVLERAAQVGGKLRTLPAGGARVDAGPTVFTLGTWFEDLFAGWGESLPAQLSLQPLEVLARHAWADGPSLDLLADRAAAAQAIGRFAGPAEARRYLDFCARAGRIFRTLEPTFMRAPRPGPLSLAWRCGWRGLPGLLQIAPFARLSRELARHFEHPRLRQLFGRYATYCGSSPALAPATLMLVAHAEQQGVWRLRGGMTALASAVQRVAEARGARVRCGAHVQRIQVRDGRVRGVELADGEVLPAEAVVFNGDAGALAQGLLGEPARAAVSSRVGGTRSLSALTWTGQAATDGFALAHHNVFFADPAARPDEFDDVFGHARLPRAPTVYICAQDRHADGDAPSLERLMVLVNAPACRSGQALGMQEIETCERIVRAHLRRCGLRLRWDPCTVRRTTPADFEALFPGSGGALYGPATHGWRSSFQRPGATTAIRGLVLAGGSVHPGPGLPMAATSGLLAAQALLASTASRDSIARSRATAMPGGISTR